MNLQLLLKVNGVVSGINGLSAILMYICGLIWQA